MAWLTGSKHAQAKRLVDQLDDPAARLAAVSGLVRMGADAIPALLEGNGTLPPARQEVLARMGPAAIPSLGKILNEAHPLQRARAAQALGLTRDPAAVPILIDALRSPYHTVRAAAASALSLLNDLRALSPLLTALKDPEPGVRASAIPALAALRDLAAFEAITDLLLDDPLIEVRQAAARALGSLRDPAALPSLMQALHDSFWWYEREAAAADLLESIQATGEAAVPLLITALRDPEGAVRRYAAILLGRLGDSRALEPLALALYDLHHDVGEAAARAIGDMGAAGLEVLDEAARHPEASIRTHAALALGAIQNGRSVTLLLQLLNDHERAVRLQAVLSLGGFQDAGARAALRELAADRSDRELQSMARQALGLAS
ncbi:MAG TPA: HEAT repeat domain-containing protein [Anaerolineales bacterium]